MNEPEIRQQLRIPIRPHVDAVMYVTYPMTESDWDQLLAVLAAMKPALVPDELKPPAGDPPVPGRAP